MRPAWSSTSIPAVWLLFGVALLALGFLRNTAALRHAGMALVCVVVAKVFLVDMAGLRGLLRVFSFLGLGAALVGLGYAYRRRLDSGSACFRKPPCRSMPCVRCSSNACAARFAMPTTTRRRTAPGAWQQASIPMIYARLEDLHRFPFTSKADLRDAYPVRHVRHPARSACASMPRAARPGGRRWSATRRAICDLWADLMARSLSCRRGAAGGHHPQRLRLRPVHRRAGRALRRRAARLHGGADVGRLRRAAGPADPRVRRAWC